MEMERICDKARLQALVRETWEGIWSPKIFQLAAREAPQNRNLSQQIQKIPSTFEKSNNNIQCAFPYTSLACTCTYRWLSFSVLSCIPSTGKKQARS